jgi:cation-transporting ATPase E
MKTLLTLILAVTCILMGTTYFFTTNNMIMYEFFVSALPSFVLSLQPNNNRVKGKFIPYVLSRAIPGAITMAVGILTLHIIRQSGASELFGFTNALGEETAEFRALMMIALTFTGLVMLYRICQPFNIVRVCLYVLSVGLCVIVIAVPALGEFVFDGWKGVDFTLQQILLIAIVIQASFPLSSFLIKFFDMINPAEE